MSSLLARIARKAQRDARKAVKAVRSLVRQIHFDVGAGADDAIFLAGGGRGGTTWIAEIINYDNEFRFIFEPFHSARVPLARPFRELQYIRPDDRGARFLEAATRVISGRFRNDWTDYHNRRVFSNQRLIKDIRANLFLKWLKQHFPALPIVLLMRHPCAVVSSRMHLGWPDGIRECLEQDELVEDWLAPWRDRILAAQPGFEAHVYRWCIENWVPLQQFDEGEIHVAFYEEFCERPVQAVESLFGFLGRPVGGHVYDALEKPSSQTRRKHSAIMFGQRPADSWRRHVTRAQVQTAVDVLSQFGMDAVFGEETLPNAAAARLMLGAPKRRLGPVGPRLGLTRSSQIPGPGV